VLLALFGPFALKVTSAGPEHDQVYVRLGSPPLFGRGWFPDEKFVLLGDGGHASYEFACFLSTGQCSALRAQDRVAPGRCRPRAPTDPYVRTLAHTVPLIMDSLRA
jgi:hypothetical protein